MKSQRIAFSGVRPFEMTVTYSDQMGDRPERHPHSHAHRQCEIYINLSGDVSFMVEDTIYPIEPGSVILTRPYEYHHCIYHGETQHRHFWILFSADGNEEWLDLFFRRPAGQQNRLVLEETALQEVTRVCRQLADPAASATDRWHGFFCLLHHLERGYADCTPALPPARIPADIRIAVEYIHAHLAEPITVEQLAAEAHVSINTLERHFATVMQMSPRAFIKQKRLSRAVHLLNQRASVSQACFESGFSDYSHFIATFKKQYGLTPLQYKKMRGEDGI